MLNGRGVGEKGVGHHNKYNNFVNVNLKTVVEIEIFNFICFTLKKSRLHV